ncbi:MAG: hypothetical protein ABJM43_04635 [Paracoccaceae bacterium]
MTLYAPMIWGSVKPLKDSFEGAIKSGKQLFFITIYEIHRISLQIVQKKMTILISFLPFVIPNRPSNKKGWRLANPMFF